MKQPHQPSGFTVIEVVLFLAITGLMLAGLMVGINGTINRERYSSTVNSLRDFMQGQYNLVSNVNTNRPASYACSGAGVSVNPPTGQARGTSDCSIVGRFITSQNGRDIVSRPLYATADIRSIDPEASENQLISDMNLVPAPEALDDDTQDYRVEWQTSVYTDKANRSAGSFSLVMLNLPTNGLIRTFAVSRYEPSIQSVISGAASQPLLLCVAPEGLISSPPLGVKILRTAANANGVQQITGGSGECS